MSTYRPRGRGTFRRGQQRFPYQQNYHIQQENTQPIYRPPRPQNQQREIELLLTPRTFLEELMNAFIIEKELDETNTLEFLEPTTRNSFIVCPPNKLTQADLYKITESRKTSPTLFILTDEENLNLYLQNAQFIMKSNQPVSFRAIVENEMTTRSKNTAIVG